MGAFGQRPMQAVTGDLSASPRSRALGVRQSLVDAMNGVPGVVAGIAAPDVATAGASWPRWVQSTYHGKLCDVVQDTYDVFVVLPGDYLATTVESGDNFRDLIEPVLMRLASITYSEPVAVQFNDSQTMPGLRFRVTVD